MLARVDADVVALQEIGPAHLLDAVLDRLPSRGGYAATIFGTADARGIRCALLSRLPVLDARVRTATALPFGCDGNLRAEMREHFFCMVARRLALDHGGLARRREPGEERR